MTAITAALTNATGRASTGVTLSAPRSTCKPSPWAKKMNARQLFERTSNAASHHQPRQINAAKSRTKMAPITNCQIASSRVRGTRPATKVMKITNTPSPP